MEFVVFDNKKFTLRKCPFCGHKANFYTFDTDEYKDCVTIHFDIRCVKCRASAPRGGRFKIRLYDDGSVGVLKVDREKLAKLWNGKARDEEDAD